MHFIAKAKTRTVLRITLIRNYNESPKYMPEFADIISQGNPHFVELKSYMNIGMSTNRLKKNDMLEMEEVKFFATGLSGLMPAFSLMDESEISRIVVLQNQRRYVERMINFAGS